MVASDRVEKIISTIFIDHTTNQPLALTPSQREIFANTASLKVPRLIVLAPTQYGKSLSISLGGLFDAVTNPNRKILIVAPKMDQATIIMNHIIDHITDHPILYKNLTAENQIEKLKTSHSKTELSWTTGSEIRAISADARTISMQGRGMMGFGAKKVIIDESSIIPDIMFGKIIRMVGGTKGQIVQIGNPFFRNHFHRAWTSDRYKKIFIDYQKGIAEGRYTREFIDEARESMLPDEFGVLYECKFPGEGEYTGQVFPEFDPSVHVVHDVDQRLDASWLYFVGIDPGIGHPAAVVIIAEDRDRNMYIVKELYEKNLLPVQLVDKIREMTMGLPAPISGIYIDPASAQRDKTSGRSVLSDLVELGLPCQPADNRVLPGITTMRKFLMAGKDDTFASRVGHGGLYISSKCEETVRQFAMYSWQVRMRPDEDPKPVKVRDDLCLSRHTSVLTREGKKNILEIRKGDYLMTPLGWSKILNVAKTGRKKTYKIGKLRATENHRIATSRGFIQLKDILPTDNILRRSSFAVSHIGGILGLREDRMRSISVVLHRGLQARRNLYTGQYGNTTTGKFRAAILSTTWMATRAIMLYLTWSLYRVANIAKGTLKKFGRWLRGVGSLGKPLQESSMQAKRAGSFIGGLENVSGKSRSQIRPQRKDVNGAGKNIQHTYPKHQSSATKTAKPKLCGIEDVYNLSTENGMFFADGVLVSNCDAIRYTIMSRPEIRALPKINPWEGLQQVAGIRLDAERPFERELSEKEMLTSDPLDNIEDLI